MTAPPRPDWLWGIDTRFNEYKWQSIGHTECRNYIEWLEQQLELCEAKLDKYRNYVEDENPELHASYEGLPWGDLD